MISRHIVISWKRINPWEYNEGLFIIAEAVHEAKERSAEQFEIEKHNLLARNKKLENELTNLKSLLSSEEESSNRPRMLSGISDAVVNVIKRNTAASGNSIVEDGAVSPDGKSLEKSMEKVMEAN